MSEEERPRFPEYQHPFLAELPARERRFAELREAFLVEYGYNTARAYWGDLDDLYLWASERGNDVLTLTRDDIRSYLRLLRRRGYSQSTIRRRLTAFRGFYGSIVEAGVRGDLPLEGLMVRGAARPNV